MLLQEGGKKINKKCLRPDRNRIDFGFVTANAA